ncbi:caspase family protein [Catenuloplanes atrovinosus]|uniref:Peptidase C14 caspase domain-containing protein n=1 Tax=Catenuloplanes atrovinosus TaxID=137266 RepID=A0AAE4C9B1_9ACTN|nr:caspase family protein [Catenuloplanes atrovinosus]MDR7276371.1 hypothetical protein [Catenuloplanes atrovinosus]
MALSDPGASRAVLIGVHSYARMPDLPAVARNLADLRAALTDHRTWGLPDGHCRVVAAPRDAEAILDAVTKAGEQATDTLLVYYAGHGLTDPHSDELHLTLPGSNPQFSATALRYDDLRRAIRNPLVRARRTVVILDCCYSGRALDGGMGATPTTEQTVTEGSHVLTAAGPTRRAWSPPGERHTAFTGELIRALTNGIPDGPELLSTDVVYRHVHTELRAKGRPEPQQANRNAGGDIVIARNRAVPGAPPPPPPPWWRRIRFPARTPISLAVVVALAAVTAIAWRLWDGARAPDTALPDTVHACRAAGTVPPGAAAAYGCRYHDGRPTAVAVYPNSAALDTAYDTVRDGARGVRSTGDCTTEEDAEHRYPVTGTAAGRVLCTSCADGTSIVWTDDDTLALLRIDAPATERVALRESWNRMVASPPAFPSPAEKKLIGMGVGTGCKRAGISELDDFPGAIAAVACIGERGQPATYFQFESLAGLQRAMTDHLPGDGDLAVESCSGGEEPDYTGGRRYDVRSVYLGVVLCYAAVDGNHIVEWSVEPLLVAGRIAGSVAASLVDWWTSYRAPPTELVVQTLNRQVGFPNEAEKALLALIPEPSRKDCMRPSEEFKGQHVGGYAVSAAVVCRAGTGPPIIFYYQFTNKKDLTENYAPDAGPDGDCTASDTAVTGESAYSRGGTTGRLRCEDQDGSLARFWTDERRLIFGLAFQGRDAKVMAEWWEHDAGPL